MGCCYLCRRFFVSLVQRLGAGAVHVQMRRRLVLDVVDIAHWSWNRCLSMEEGWRRFVSIGAGIRWVYRERASFCVWLRLSEDTTGEGPTIRAEQSESGPVGQSGGRVMRGLERIGIPNG